MTPAALRKVQEGRSAREAAGLLELDGLERADAYAARYQQPEEAAQFGAMVVDPVTGELRSYASMIEPAARAGQQLELALPKYNRRAEIRRALADKIEREVVPRLPLPWVAKIPDKLRNARKSGTFGVHTSSGRGVVLWDDKAALSRLCPDDAREEAARLQRRYLEHVQAQWAKGLDVHYAVFTMPNFAPGELGKGMRRIFERYKNLTRKPDGGGPSRLPQIEGSLVVLEAPLSARGDWNVHLNALLVVRGFLDYAKLRELWHWNVEVKRLPRNNPEALAGAFREIIKYAVQATAEKSADKAAGAGGDLDPDAGDQGELDGLEGAPGALMADQADQAPPGPADQGSRPAAPPMLEWRGQELAEWLSAMHGFRRTRSYGCLFGAPKAAPADLTGYLWLGSIRWRGRGYALRLRLFDSIPEDNSHGGQPLERWRRWVARLRAAPDPAEQLARSTRAG